MQVIFHEDLRHGDKTSKSFLLRIQNELRKKFCSQTKEFSSTDDDDKKFFLLSYIDLHKVLILTYLSRAKVVLYYAPTSDKASHRASSAILLHYVGRCKIAQNPHQIEE